MSDETYEDAVDDAIPTEECTAVHFLHFPVLTRETVRPMELIGTYAENLDAAKMGIHRCSDPYCACDTCWSAFITYRDRENIPA